MAAVDDNARRALLTSLFAPTESCSLEGSAETKTYLILSCLDNVVSEQRFWKYDGTRFTLERTFKGVMGVSPSVSAVDAQGSDAIWVTSAGYTQPTTLALADAAAPEAQEKLKALPAFFNAEGLRTEQHYATSADGTKIPYFLVSRADAPRDGSTPCLLYGYGGFEVSLTPSYSGGVGAAWLEKGYAYVQVSCLNRTSLFACLI
jgi:prolyl oligopeptidase